MLELADYYPLIDSMKRYRPDYYPIANLSQLKNKQEPDLPVVSGDSTILLNEVIVTAKGYKPFRDKMMGRLDSLAQMKMGVGWGCDCGSQTPNGYLNDCMGYSHHPAGCPSNSIKTRSTPVNGKDYQLIKYEPKGANGT